MSAKQHLVELFCSRYSGEGFFHAKCLKCGKIGHMKSVCKATAQLATSDDKPSSSDFVKSGISNDQLSLFTTSKSNLHIQK